MFANQNFDTVIDEALTAAELTPKEVSTLRSLLQSHYAEHTIMVTDHYPSVVKRLYGFNDNNM